MAKITYGMVGGGPGAFIGDVHRKAAKFDGKIELKAGSFSRDYQKSLKTAVELGLDKERVYKNYQEMAAEEAAREDGIDFVAIVTPNNTHYEIAKVFLENGINVLCDKPLTTTSEEAAELKKIKEKNDLLFAVSYTYSGYPMLKEAKRLIKEGELGKIRMIMAEYPQEWLAEKASAENKQASWRTDPERAGISNCMGDIGTHIENTVSYVTGLQINRLSAKLSIFVEGRKLDDNGQVMIDYHNGARGIYWASQVAIGCDNGLKFRIYGSKASLEWEQEKPNQLYFSKLNGKTEILKRGHAYLGEAAKANSRIPAGHPEGYFEAFANIYSNFADALIAKKEDKNTAVDQFDYPDLEAGLAGVKFVEKCVESSNKDAAWVDFN